MINGYSNNSQILQQNSSQNQSISSAQMIISKTNDIATDDYNFKKGFGQQSPSENINIQSEQLSSRNQQYKIRKQQLISQMGGNINRTEGEEENNQTLQKLQSLNNETYSIKPFQQLENQNSVTVETNTKRRQRRDNSLAIFQQNSPLKVNPAEIKKEFNIENRVQSSNINKNRSDEQTNLFNTFGQESLIDEDQQIQTQRTNRSQFKKSSIAINLQKFGQSSDDEDSPKRHIKREKKLQFAEEDQYNFFDVIENNSDFLQEFQLIQQTAFNQSKQKYQQENFSLKSILKIQKKAPKLKKQNSKSLTDLDRSAQNLSQIGNEIKASIFLKNRQNISLNANTSIFGGQKEQGQILVVKKNKKVKKDSSSTQFAHLKKAYEKDNYIKRLSSVSQQKVEKFHQFLRKQNKERQKQQRICYFLYYLVVDLISLHLIKFQALDKSIINYYLVVLNYFRLFYNAAFIGTLLFLYRYLKLSDFNKQIQWPFTTSSDTYSDNYTFLTSQSTFTSYMGFILFLVLAIQVFRKGEFTYCSLLNEKQATRLIFNSIKWNTFCVNRNNYLSKKYKMYDKILEENDYFEGQYPYQTISFIILIEIALISFNLVSLYFILNNQKLIDYLNEFNAIYQCCLLSHLIIGALIVILVKINHFVIQLVYIYVTKITFSGAEKFMMQVMTFNTFLIYIIFQYRYIAVFNSNINFHFLNKISKQPPIVSQVFSQIGFIIALTTFYLSHSFFKCFLFSKQKKLSFSGQRLITSNKIFDTANTNINEEQKKQISQEEENNNKLNNSKEDNNQTPEKKIKNFQVTPETLSSPQQIHVSEDQQKSIFCNNSQQFKSLLLNDSNSKKNRPLIIKSVYYQGFLLLTSMMNSSILNCIFTYPLILPLGFILNLLLIVSFYLVNKEIDPNGCLTFLTIREFKQMANQIVYTSLAISIIQNFLIANSDQYNSDIQIQQSLFQQGFGHLYDVNVINQLLALISLPYLLYSILLYLIMKIYMLNKSYKQQFQIYKTHLEKSKEPHSSQSLSVSKSDFKKIFNFI